MAEGVGSAAAGGAVDQLPGYKQARRKRILAAASSALQTQEYEQVQVRDVAQAADVALGTLYRYFSSKEHLYAAVLLHWLAPDGTVESYGPDGASVVERVRVYMRTVIAAFHRRPQFFRVMMLLLNAPDPEAKVQFAEFIRLSQQRLSGELWVLDEPARGDVAKMLWSVITTTLQSTIYDAQPVADAYRICDRLVDLLEPLLTAAEEAARADSS